MLHQVLYPEFHHRVPVAQWLEHPSQIMEGHGFKSHLELGNFFPSSMLSCLSVIVRENRAGAKDRGRPFTFIFSQYKSYLKRLGMVAFAEVDVRFSSRNHHSIILGPPAAKNNRDFGQLCVTVKHTSYDS